jgi:hypothetical protein
VKKPKITTSLPSRRPDAVRQWFPVIPDILALEYRKYGQAGYMNIITMADKAVDYIPVPDDINPLEMETSAALELFQCLWEGGTNAG